MADWHRLTNRMTGETYTAASLDGLDLTDWDAVPIIANQAPGEFQTTDDAGTLTTDLEAVKTSAKKAIDAAQGAAFGQQFGDLAAAISVAMTWSDIKRAERDIQDNRVPTLAGGALDIDAINERYPFLAAIAFVANIPIDQALQVAKAELWPQMVDVAVAAAKALLARRDVDQAASATAVQAVSGAVDLET